MPLAALLLDADQLLLDTRDALRRGFTTMRDADAPRSADAARAALAALGVAPNAGASERDLVGQAVAARAHQGYLDALRAGPLALRDGARELAEAARARGLRVGVLAPSRELYDAMDAGSGGALASLGTALPDAPDAARPHETALHRAADALGLFGAECAVVAASADTVGRGRNAGVVGVGVTEGAAVGDLRGERALVERRFRAAGARAVYPTLAAFAADLDAALDRLAPGHAPVTRALAERLMREALAVAREGMAAGEAPIGCVLARGDGSVVARGYNEMNRSQNKTAHAEIVTFARAAGRVPLDARDLIMVSTLEPCVMCTGAAMESAVDTIVYALRAPADSGTGRVQPPESPESQMPRIVGDVLAAESRALFEAWMDEHRGEPQAAYVEQLLALT